MKLLCRLGWHEYTKWQHEGEVTVVDHDLDYPHEPTPQSRRYEIQKRECVHCGIKKMRRERK